MIVQQFLQMKQTSKYSRSSLIIYSLFHHLLVQLLLINQDSFTCPSRSEKQVLQVLDSAGASLDWSPPRPPRGWSGGHKWFVKVTWVHPLILSDNICPHAITSRDHKQLRHRSCSSDSGACHCPRLAPTCTVFISWGDSVEWIIFYYKHLGGVPQPFKWQKIILWTS